MKGKAEGHTNSGKARTYTQPSWFWPLSWSVWWKGHGTVVRRMGQCTCHGWKPMLSPNFLKAKLCSVNLGRVKQLLVWRHANLGRARDISFSLRTLHLWPERNTHCGFECGTVCHCQWQILLVCFTGYQGRSIYSFDSWELIAHLVDPDADVRDSMRSEWRMSHSFSNKPWEFTMAERKPQVG